MATYHGRGGFATVGSTTSGADDTILNVTAWTYEQTAPVSEYTSMGDTAKNYKLGYPAGSGTVDCYFNPGVDTSDTDGQDLLWTALGAGTSIQVQLSHNTATAGQFTSGDPIYQGTVVVTSFEIGGTLDGMVTASFAFRGILDETTYSTA